MKRTATDKRGFTLVEILVVVAIMGVVMGAVYSLYITNMRTAYTHDEVSDMQLNLRIAMDSVVRDLRMAGMLIDYQAAPPVLPIQAAVNNTGVSSPLSEPFTNVPNPGSDSITLNMASATGIYGRINIDNGANGTAITSLFTLSPKQLDSQVGDAEQFQVGDIVRIIRPRGNSQPAGVATTFAVNAVTGGLGPNAQTVTVGTRGGVEFQKTDVIAKANAYNPPTALSPSPNTVQYAVVTNGSAPATNTTHPNCPVNQFCLARLANNEVEPIIGGPRWEIVAQNIRNFQLEYVTSDAAGGISDVPPDDLSTVTAVKVTISGQTVTSRPLSGNTIKTRQLESFVKLINRRTVE